MFGYVLRIEIEWVIFFIVDDGSEVIFKKGDVVKVICVFEKWGYFVVEYRNIIFDLLF